MDIEKEVFDDGEDALPEEFQHMSVDAINQRARLLENEIRVLKDESTRLTLDQNGMKEKIKENKEKIKLNNQLPYLVRFGMAWRARAFAAVLCGGVRCWRASVAHTTTALVSAACGGAR